MARTASHDAWVLKVLGIELAAAPAAPLAIWQGAKDQVDLQLNALYGALRSVDIPALAEIADEIENALRPFRVGLTTALTDYGRAPDPERERLRPHVLKIISEYRATLAADQRVAAADDNPFGIQVTARRTLGAALNELQHQLTAA